MLRKKYIIFILSLILVIIVYVLINSININIYTSNIGAFIQDKLIVDVKPINKEITLGINKKLELENNELKELLGLKEEIYNLTIAKVLKRDNWYQELIINKGSKDNIKINDSIISDKNLIGRVKVVEKNHSIIELITSNNETSRVSVKIGDTYGIISSYSYNDDVFIVSNLLKNSNINLLDKVYTSGLGELDDAGIYIGYVIDIEYDNLGIGKNIKVKSNIDLNNIRYVGVISK